MNFAPFLDVDNIIFFTKDTDYRFNKLKKKNKKNYL